MAHDRWTAAKLKAIGVGLLVASALVTEVMVANQESGPTAESPANGRESDAACLQSRGSLSSPCAGAQP